MCMTAFSSWMLQLASRKIYYWIPIGRFFTYYLKFRLPKYCSWFKCWRKLHKEPFKVSARKSWNCQSWLVMVLQCSGRKCILLMMKFLCCWETTLWSLLKRLEASWRWDSAIFNWKWSSQIEWKRSEVDITAGGHHKSFQFGKSIHKLWVWIFFVRTRNPCVRLRLVYGVFNY